MSEKKTLEQIRTQLAEIEARRAKRAEKSPEEQLDDAQRQLADAEAIDAAEEEHGRVGDKIAVYETPLGAVIVKRAPQVVWNKFANSDKVDTAATFALVKSALVHPTLARFESILEEQPAILVPIGDLVAKLCGLRAQALAGK